LVRLAGGDGTWVGPVLSKRYTKLRVTMESIGDQLGGAGTWQGLDQ
jgi:hypothetical protein